ICFQVCRVLDRLDPFDRLTFVDSRETERLPKAFDGKSGLVAVNTTTGEMFSRERALGEALKVLPFGWAYSFCPTMPILNRYVRRALGFRRTRRNASKWWGARKCPLPPSETVRAQQFTDHK